MTSNPNVIVRGISKQGVNIFPNSSEDLHTAIECGSARRPTGTQHG
ncbi:hypothetical protein ANCCAN_22713 [Ancylostoma caninum]|uniref:Uncharacterized protein n=1 Tax=Ancylostoma caninum TaxID=29170 RepID=A0A368FKV7_ANCCA|nr:hypothetical protein ANCCAN_22713 [Ancylostoma caninum]